jgi:M6 family metalloprotease-like protein
MGIPHKLCNIFLVISFTISKLYSVPACPDPFTITQADGSELTIRMRGDEFFHYSTTEDGYALIPDSSGILTYAIQDTNGKLISTHVRASNTSKRNINERKFIQGLSQNINLTSINQTRRAMRSAASSSTNGPQKAYPLTGTPKSLVILVNFSDLSFLTPSPKTAFTNLVNQAGYSTNGGTGSAKDYFNDNSMGVFNPQFDVVGPFTLLNTMSFYGQNDAQGNDLHPQQMVIDACKQANLNGVDFSQYDTDHNGIVDNVFIYYAGHNEAEGGSPNSIWPHRWSLPDQSTVLNGVAVYDYACTSELRSSTGNNMCGIGTFCHEFGHVLGLPDYYATNHATHQTLSYWNIMDAGPYLNLGRTPPAYSAFDRFFLNWLIPTEIKDAGNYSLDNLSTTNKAYVLTQFGNHNLNGANPSPPEFFTLENRQKSGWDSFLPGHGMLITHIFYDPATWEANTPNNDPNAMGVDIVEADGIASDANLAGDPFPGVNNVTNINLQLRSGTLIGKPLSAIQEYAGLISFKLKGGIMTIVPPVALPIATSDTTTRSYKFIANWNQVPTATGYYLTVYNTSSTPSTIKQGFDNGLTPPSNWTISTQSINNSSSYCGIKIPALQFNNNNDYLQTEKFILPAIKLSFFTRSINGIGALYIEGENSNGVWEKIDSLGITTSLNIIKNYALAQTKGYNCFRFTFKRVTGSITFDDLSLGFDKTLNYDLMDKWTTATSDTVLNLIPNTEYNFKVKASDKGLLNGYENITDFSNTISVSTLPYPKTNTLVARVDANRNIWVILPTTDPYLENSTLQVYNAMGQCVKTIAPNSNPYIINDLPKNQIYILRVNGRVAKIKL